MNIYKDGNVFCPFCGEEAAGFKVYDNYEGNEHPQWWHRCWNPNTDKHEIVLVYEDGTEELFQLGEKIFLSEDGTQVEGNGRTLVYNYEPIEPEPFLTLDLGSLEDLEKDPNMQKSEMDFEMKNPLTGEMENVHLTVYDHCQNPKED